MDIKQWLLENKFKESKSKPDLFYKNQVAFLTFVDLRNNKKEVYVGGKIADNKRFDIAKKFVEQHPELGLKAIDKTEQVLSTRTSNQPDWKEYNINLLKKLGYKESNGKFINKRDGYSVIVWFDDNEMLIDIDGKVDKQIKIDTAKARFKAHGFLLKGETWLSKWRKEKDEQQDIKDFNKQY